VEIPWRPPGYRCQRFGHNFVVYGVTSEFVRASIRNQADLNDNNNYHVQDGAYEVQVEAERNEKIALRIQKKIEKAKGKNEWLLLGELPAVGATKSSSKSKSAPQGDASSLSKQLSLAGSSAAIIREKAHTPTDRDELTIRLQSLDDLVERTVKDFNKAEEVMLALVQDVKSLKGDITEINTLLESELESIRTELNAFNVRPGDFEVGVLG